MHKYFQLLTMAALTATTPLGLMAQKMATEVTVFDAATAMDRSVKPGDDFYRYAGGGWLKAHPLKPEHARYGSFDQLAETNERQIRTLIEEQANKRGTRGSIEQKVGDLYALAMDTTRRNREGIAPVRSLLAKVEGIQSRKAYQLTIAELARKGVGSLFAVYLSADIKDSKRHLMHTYQAGMTLGQRDYYLETDAETQKVMAAYRDYIVQLFTLAGYTPTKAEQKVADVLRIETAMARAAKTQTELRDDEANYNKMSYATLVERFAGIDWGSIFLTMGYPAFDEINVAQIAPIEMAERLLREEPLEVLKNYALFRTLDAFAPQLGQAFDEAHFALYGRVMSGRTEQRALWKRAVSSVDNVLGEAVGKLYVARHFPAEAKAHMEQLVKNLQLAMAERINAQTWLDPLTKQRAHEKLNTFLVKIGYPETWKDYTALDIDPTLSYAENLMRAAEFELAYDIAKRAGKPVDVSEWHMTPQTVNAYYNPTTNEICFPAGILQPPFFDVKADDAVNYGSIGVVIGHEMTHGFDDQGRIYDKDGNLNDWWTEADGQRFKQRARVMVDYFNAIEVLPGLHANGELTLGENIADHGGLKVAYLAFEKALQQSGKTQKVDGFTPEQRFFLAYAFTWVQNIRDEQVRQYTKSDPHSLAEWRVNGALPHFDPWYTAFGIKKSDKLYIPKKKRVDLW
ncbi:MAG: M13 family metallopeptidase [Bacteroidales bacterium]|nr:M13 family metallopeptidase [Bacteroidales bacterium]